MNPNIISLKNINKCYKNLHILKDINLEFQAGKFYAIMGPSGAGKTTLINIIGLLDRQTSGRYHLMEQDVSEINPFKAAKIRNMDIGFIFQSFYLLPHLNAIENVMLPMYLDASLSISQMKERAKNLLYKFGLEERTEHKPSELSAGEQQRVAIARALANHPQVIIADEPTGNLDEENERLVFQVLRKLADEGKTIIAVSHNKEILNYSDSPIYLRNGIVGGYKEHE